ncbi:MAG: hypothetical protein K2Q01_08620 [Rickettsiales bacterium]|nr:hypothetical protein [Rickettsiales bacterium]
MSKDNPTYQDLGRPYDRREFLRNAGCMAGGVGFVGVVGTGAYGIKKLVENTILDPSYSFPPAGDTSQPMRQEDVNQTYKRIYDQLHDAQQQAIREHKKLRVVMGELHDKPIPYMHTAMVIDAAHRLGIKEYVIEQPNEKFDQLVRSCKSISDSKKSILRSQFVISDTLQPLAQRHKELGPAARELCGYIYSVLDDGIEAAHKLKTVKDAYPSNSNMMVYAGGELRCGDPERNDGQGKKRGRHDPIVENAMVDAVAGLDKNSIASFGLSHLPFLVEGLKGRGDTLLLALDVSNATPTLKLAGRPSQRWADHLLKLKNEGLVHTLLLHGQEPSFDKAAEMVLLAGIHHRSQRHHGKPPELDATAVAFMQEFLPTAVATLQKDVQKDNGPGR